MRSVQTIRGTLKKFRRKFGPWTFNVEYIVEPGEAKEAVKSLLILEKKLLGLDIETAKLPEWKEHSSAGLCPHLSKPRLLQIYDGVKTVYVFDVFKIPWKVLTPILTKGSFVAHNGIFEILHLTHAGIPDMNVGCSMLLSMMIQDAEVSPYDPLPEEEEEDDKQSGLARYRRVSHSLDGLIQRLYGIRVAKDEQVSDWGAKVLTDSQVCYAALDAVLTYHAAVKLAGKLKEYEMVKYYHHVKSMQQVIADIQLRGLPVDWKYHRTLIARWEEASTAAEKKCKPYFKDTNVRSNKQMGVWLKEYLKKDPITLANWPATKTGYAFGKTVISSYKHLPAIAVLLEYKVSAKLLDTYGESLAAKAHPLTKRLHTSYTLGVTRTGRLSSRDPNCQNFPSTKEFRNLFHAEPGYVIAVSDFSQIEVRLQAEFSHDPRMCDVYREGRDIYCEMATVIFGRPITKADKKERFIGKCTVLGMAYGMGPSTFERYAINAGVDPHSVSFWREVHQAYHRTFSVYSKWCDRMRFRAKKLGYIETLMGKRRKLSEDEVYTRAPNTVIQGTASELMGLAMKKCAAKMPGMVATVHDEILLHVPKECSQKAKEVLEYSMNDAMREMFPHAVSHHVADAAFGERWGDVKGEL